jgi:hypothetical protein
MVAEIEYVTIFSGSGVLPHVMPKWTMATTRQHAEFHLGGWAAEDYFAFYSKDYAKCIYRALASMAPNTGRESG